MSEEDPISPSRTDLKAQVYHLEELNDKLTKQNEELKEEIVRIKSEAFEYKNKKEKLEIRVEELKDEKLKYKLQAESLELKWYNPWMAKVLNGMTMNLAITDQVAYWRMKFFTKIGSSEKEVITTAKSDIRFDRIIEVIVFIVIKRNHLREKETRKYQLILINLESISW